MYHSSYSMLSIQIHDNEMKSNEVKKDGEEGKKKSALVKKRENIKEGGSQSSMPFGDGGKYVKYEKARHGWMWRYELL